MNTRFTQMGITTRRWRYQLSSNRRVVCSYVKLMSMFGLTFLFTFTKMGLSGESRMPFVIKFGLSNILALTSASTSFNITATDRLQRRSPPKQLIPHCCYY